jgi:hypothetical protein
MATDAFTSSAAIVVTATAIFTRNLHSLISSANVVVAPKAFAPYKVPTANPISTVPYYDPALNG